MLGQVAYWRLPGKRSEPDLVEKPCIFFRVRVTLMMGWSSDSRLGDDKLLKG
jgi:hypothetical protein